MVGRPALLGHQHRPGRQLQGSPLRLRRTVRGDPQVHLLTLALHARGRGPLTGPAAILRPPLFRAFEARARPTHPEERRWQPRRYRLAGTGAAAALYLGPAPP